MKILPVFFAILISLPQMCIAQNESALLDKVKAKLNKVNDYSAEGKMKIDVAFVNAPASKVRIYYKKPDKFKVIKDGGISLLPKGGVSVNVNALLLSDDFTIIPSGVTNINGSSVKILKLLPVNEQSDVVLATVYVDEKNLVIVKYAVTTRESGTYDMDLSYGKFISYGLPDKVVFSFNTKDYKMPKGITFEYEKGEKKKDEDKLKSKKGKVEITYAAYVINKGIDDTTFEGK
jgi:outer membrane lipoprotein-sorting protein